MRIAVIHQLPLEYYPPATNLLDHLSRNGDLAVDAFSTFNPKGRPDWKNSRIRIMRFPFPGAECSWPKRLFRFASFLLGTVWQLALRRPHAVLYIEPHSALPAYFYKRFLNPKAALYHHCHEYYPADDFERPGMRLVKLAHRFETGYLYREAVWISQTNADRVRLFLKDYPELDASKIHALPNLPPSSWSGTENKAWRISPPPLRFVYVGSISLEDTYIRELCDWVKRLNGEVTLDIFAYNVRPETGSWLRERSKSESGIRYLDKGLAYEELPKVLPDYHVGLILYRGNTENFVWNAPNKLFEYLACGLDVWYPPVMLGMETHQRADVFPKVVPIDFERLESIDLPVVTDRNGLARRSDTRYCDEVLCDLEESLKEV